MTAPIAALGQLLSPGDERDRAMTHQLRTAAVCLAAVVLAFHYSLSTLLRTLQVDTPLAYLGLVPAIALALVARRARTGALEPPIHDRQVDYLVGLPLLALAVGINLLLPARMSAMFWLWRIDLLALPLFASGAIVVLFGVRALWRLRLPMLFLFLAWPLPYTAVLLRQLDVFTSATLVGVRAGVRALPGIAKPVPGEPTLFEIQHHGGPFQVGVASACSGVNGLVGYALVGGALVFELVGSRLRRALWLLAGLALVWVLNVARILAIFAAGHVWGERFAIDALHPVLGLILFNVGVLVMLLTMGRFGLSLGPARGGASAASGDPACSPTPVGSQAPRPERHRDPVVRRTRLAVSVVAAFGLLCGIANADLRGFDLVANLDGTPKLTAYQEVQGHPLGWRARKVAEFGWAKQYFGSDSSWIRYEMAWDGITKTAFDSRAHVIVDVVSTTDPSRFQSYGVEACYQFHGFGIRSQRSVDFGGTTARVVSWSSSALDTTWTTVYWIWPVKTRTGTRYERIVMMMSDGATVRMTAAAPGHDASRSIGLAVTDRLTGKAGDEADARTERIQDFLLALARTTVDRQPAARDET